MLRQLQVELADGKGVPLIRERVEATPVQGPKPVSPQQSPHGDRGQGLLVRSQPSSARKCDVALFRDERPESSDPETKRPSSCHKRMTACFPTVEEVETEDELAIRGYIHVWTWTATQIQTPHRSDAASGRPSVDSFVREPTVTVDNLGRLFRAGRVAS